jgi:hypothetical protein
VRLQRRIAARRPAGWRRAVLLGLVLAVSGGLRPALQGVAWTGMLVRYSRTVPLREAVRQTFDGEHPCAMCLALRAAAAQKSQPELSAPAGAGITHLFCQESRPWPSATDPAHRVCDAVFQGSDLSFPPPHPPPRGRSA